MNKIAMVVEGTALLEILGPLFKKQFLQAAILCDSVVVCRATPK